MILVTPTKAIAVCIAPNMNVIWASCFHKWFPTLSAKLNFRYLSYSVYLISRLAFFLASIELLLRTSRESPGRRITLLSFFITALWKKLFILKYTNRKIKMRRSDFNLKRNTNPNKIEKRKR